MKRSPSRYEWIDLLRGIAVLGMIWTHAANTFLDKSLQGAQTFQNMTYFHGLVAPLFFWVAGYMRGLSAAKPGPRKPLMPTVKRLLCIFGLGYLLHVPWDPLLKGDFSEPVLKILFQSDVLQALAVSSFLLLLVEQAQLSKRAMLSWALFIGMAALLMTQFRPDVSTGILAVDGLISPSFGSLFPLCPWAAFACAGFIIGLSNTMSWMLFFVSALAAFVFPSLPKHPDVISFFFERLGWVGMFTVLVMKGSMLMPSKVRSLVAPWLLLLGRQSLIVYVAHLVMIYWTPMVRIVGIHQGYAGVLALFLGLTLASLGLAWCNERRKTMPVRIDCVS